MLQLLESLLRFLGPFRTGMFANDSLIQFPGVGNVRLPFLKLRRFKEAFRTLSATTDDQTQGEKHAYEQQCAFSKDHGNPSCRLAACTPRDENRTSRSTLCHPRRLSPTLVPDLIGDPVKEWIQAIYEDPGVFLFPSYTPQKPSLDSCFRRNDRKRNRGSRVFAFFFVREENDTGFPI